MKSVKKNLAIALAVILCICTVTACTEKKQKEIAFDENGNYKPTEKLELTIWETQGSDYVQSQGADENIVEEWLKEKSMVDIETIFGNGGSQWDNLLSRLIAGDNLPDIIHCGGSQGPAHFAKLNEIGSIWELTPEMLEKYAPNLWNRVPDELWERMKIDGKIYGIPYGLGISEETQPQMTAEQMEFAKNNLITIKSDVQNALWIRDDISQKLFPGTMSWEDICKLIEETNEPIGDQLMDIPINTTEDYMDLLYKIKDLNLTEGEKTVYPFGYQGADNWVALTYLGAEMLGYTYHCYTSSWNDMTREMRLPLTEPIVREAARLHNQMMRDKVIDPESLVQTQTMFKEKAANGNYIILPIEQVGSSWEAFNKQLKEDGKNYQYRPLYTNVPAPEGYTRFKQPVLWADSIALTTELSEAEVIQVLNWINIQFSDEFEEILWWGPADKELYTEDENGTRRYKDERFNQLYLEGKTDALGINETMGIGITNGTFYMTAMPITQPELCRWNPKVMHQHNVFTPDSRRVLGFKADSEHVKAVKMFPPCQIWAPEFASIPEVVTYWAERGRWEQPFTIALSADLPETFEAKWDEALENLYSITDIDEMCRKMTEIARTEADKMEGMVFDVSDGY